MCDVILGLTDQQVRALNDARELLWELAQAKNKALRERAIKALQGYPSAGDVARLRTS